jgi:hypothetical protein
VNGKKGWQSSDKMLKARFACRGHQPFAVTGMDEEIQVS